MKHYYQISNVGCVQGATATLLSSFDIDKTPAQITREVPIRSWPGTSEPAGTPNQDAGAYLCKLGLEVEIISFDTWITDLSWVGRDTRFIENRLREMLGKSIKSPIGYKGSQLYIEAYLDFIEAGGTIRVEIAPTSRLIKDLLSDGPIMATVAYDTLHGEGKSVNGPKLFESRYDDIEGHSPNHNIVITDCNDESFEFYDPWKKPGVHWVESDRLIASIATAQQECDNMLVVVGKK